MTRGQSRGRQSGAREAAKHASVLAVGGTHDPLQPRRPSLTRWDRLAVRDLCRFLLPHVVRLVASAGDSQCPPGDTPISVLPEGQLVGTETLGDGQRRA
jgi:hypothetical protein